MSAPSPVRVAIRLLVRHILEQITEAAIARAEALESNGGSGRLLIVVDLKDGRIGWGQSFAIDHVPGIGAVAAAGEKLKFDLKEARPL